MKTPILFLLFSLNYIYLFSQPNTEFEHIKIGNKLNSIASIKKDKQGFIWIGSDDQLIKYDGYKTINYTIDSSVSKSPPIINCIFTDTENQIWIGANNGLYKFNPATEKFKFIKLDTVKGNFDNYWVEGIYQDKKDFIWVTAYGFGLLKIHKDKGFISNYTEGFSFYSPILFKLIDSFYTKGKLITKIAKPAELKQLSQEFKISQKSTILIVATSGGYQYKGIESQTWIEDKRKHKLWEMDYKRTADAGKDKFARIQTDTLHLEKGSYQLIYNNTYNEETYYKNLEGINLFVINPDECNEVLKYLRAYKKPHSITTNYLRALFGETQNNKEILWLGHVFGFDKITLSDLDKNPEKFENHTFESVKTIYRKANEPLWMGCPGKGLYQFNEKTQSLTDYNFIFNQKPGNNETYIGEIQEDKQGITWIKECNEGLYSYNKKSGESTHFSNNYDNPKSLSSNYGTGLLIDSSGIIWIDAKGIDKINNNKYKFARYLHNPFNLNSLSCNDVTSVIRDNTTDHEILWIATRGGGLNKFDKTKNKFIHFRHSPKNINSICSDTISVVFKSRKNELWIGSWGSGISVLTDENKLTFKHYKHSANTPKSLSSNIIKAIYEDSFDNIWIATNNGLCKYNKENNNFICNPIESQINNDETLSLGLFIEDYYHQLWLSNFYGLYKFDLIKNKLSQYAYKSGAGQGSVYKDVFYAYQDKQKAVWACTRRGLSRYNRNLDNFSTFFKDTSVCTVYEDKSGIFWVGTFDFGLYQFDRKSLLKKTCALDKNLLKNGYFIFSDDNNGYLWIINGTGNIIQYHPKRGTMNIYDDSDGLQDIYFTIPYQAISENQLTKKYYTIGLGGLNIIDLRDMNKNPFPPPVFITNILLYNQPVVAGQSSIIKKNINYIDELVLGHDQNYFSFEFAALDYTNPLKNRYKHKLEGVDRNWIETDGTNRIANYTNINPGTYTFRVKASNNDGVWNFTGKSLKITIKPPFWATWWAYFFYLTTVAFIIYTYRKFLINREIEKSDNRLKQFEIIKMKELDEHKSQFFANISHEFRTPLTLILGSIDQLRSHDDLSDEQESTVKLMEKNSNRLYQLVNQLLELSKMDEGKMKIRLGHGNLSDMLKYIFSSYESIAERKRIKFNILNPLNDVIGYWDKEKLEIIVHNLLSNAFKFTPGYGQVTVEYSSIEYKQLLEKIQNKTESNAHQGKFLFLTIKDTGHGIAEENINTIFDRFEKVIGNGAHYREGMGIGLALTKELVDFQGGYLFVQSQINCGSTFSIFLPIEKEGFSNPEILECELESSHSYIDIPEINYSNEKVKEFINDSKPELEKEVHTILIVEDNADMQNFLYQNLKNDYSIELANNGIEGWEKACNSIPDLIVTDLMMPRRDGLSLCSMLKNDQRTSHIPVIILTAKASVENRIVGLQTGADDYLEKPFKTDELKIRIQNLIMQRERLKEKYSKMLGFNTQHIEALNMDEVFFKKAISLVEENLLNDAWSISDFSESMNMSRSQLFRKIKALTALSVSDFILSIRLQKAANLLINNVGTVTEIAFKVGFNDSSYFAKCFRKKYHLSPRSYALQFKHNVQ